MADDGTSPLSIRINGTPLEEGDGMWLAHQAGGGSRLFASAATARGFRLGAGDSRGPADAAESKPEEIPADALVEIEFENGLRFWTSGDRLKARLTPAGDEEARGGSPANGTWTLPSSLEILPGTRGTVGKLIIKALRWVGFDPVRAARDKIVEIAETRAIPREGLFQVGKQGLVGDPLEEPIPDGERTLVLLHGTASSTHGSFAKLWDRQPEQWQRLRESFGERIYALEHCTLTRSPIENALQVARLLPGKGRLYLLSHSRGGLVGELLCLDPDTVDPAGVTAALSPGPGAGVDEAAAFKRQREQFESLMSELHKRPGLEIARFARVACPVLGTSLAGDQLDQWLSLLVLAAIADEMRRSQSRGFGSVALSAAQYGLDALAEITASVIASRKNAADLPGLQAQMPGSPLVRILNAQRARGELFVVAGDAEPEPGDWLAALRFWLIDNYYRRDHDLVVDTRAMLDGAQRSSHRVQFRSGADVNHFSYFGNSDSAAAIADALTDSPAAETSFRPYAGEWPLPAKTTRGLFSPRPQADPELKKAKGIVLLVPGLCGSELQVNHREVWANLLALAGGQFRSRLKIDNGAVEPGDPLADTYLALANHLRGNGYVVRMHGYDWRKSILDSTGALAARLQQALDDAKTDTLPVHAIVHSMGGVLIRATFATHPELWTQWNGQPGDGRVIMLGTPNQGSHAVTELITARDAFFGKLALLDLANSEEELLKIAVNYPGVLELLPSPANVDENGREIRDPGTWEKYFAADERKRCPWPRPPAAPLGNSAGVWQRLAESDPLIDSERLIYVAGKAEHTYQQVRVSDGRLALLTTGEGDGRVTWASGIPKACREGRRLYYLDSVHGDMPKASAAYPALQELLELGRSARPELTSTPPQARGPTRAAAAPTFGPRPEMLYPTRADLLAAAQGGSTEAASARAAPALPPVAVKVTHGNLMFATAPVLVGHFQGNNNLEQAERLLDRAMRGRMRQRLDAGLYAGPLGTYSLFPKLPGELFAAGAIVVGIGRIGELSPGQLTEDVARALAAYAIRAHGHASEGERPASEAAGSQELNVCTLLIGAGVGEISLADSVTAILRGLREANQRLANAGLVAQVRYAQLEFIELMEDRAIQAIKAARLAVNLEAELRRSFVVDAALTIGSGGWRRAYAEFTEGAWHRVVISTVDSDGKRGSHLLFSVHGDLARAEQMANAVPLKSVDEMVQGLIRTESDNPSIGRTLFELMLPNWLKDQAPDRRRVQLVVDKAAAAYPWELIRDRAAGKVEQAEAPVAVRSGMVRQLLTGQFRTAVKRPGDFAALVIGDPLLGKTAQWFKPLDGARVEADEVQELLHAFGYEADDALIQANAARILVELYKRDWRVLHLSGHGVYNEPLSDRPDAPMETGMLIGQDLVLTPAHINQMRVVPDIVFLNCCSLGRTEETEDSGGLGGHPRLAANLATQLIEMGVRGVIAAGWRVQDEPARLFAKTFYGAMLAGEPFGEAVLAARQEVFDQHPRSNTWGAYQCYGDPTFILPPAPRAGTTAGDRGRPVRYDYVSASEVQVELDRIALKAAYHKGETPAERTRREEKVDALARLCELHGWLSTGTMNEAFGRLWGEYSEHDRAIASYRAAQQAPDGSASLRCTEQLANMLARKASRLLDDAKAKGGDSRKPAAKLLEEAQILLDGVAEIGPTLERLSLKAATVKRRLELAEGDEIAPLLDKMATDYRAAAALQSNADRYYPALNALHADWLRHVAGMLDADALGRAREWSAELRRELPVATNFWERTYTVDLSLIEVLLAIDNGDGRGAKPDLSTVTAGYRELLGGHVAPRERDSVLGTLKIFCTVLERLEPGGRGRASLVPRVRKALAQMLEQLGRD